MSRRFVPGLLLVLVVVLLVAALVRHHRTSPPPVPHGPRHHAVLGPVRPLPPGLLGVNGEAIIGPGVWSNSRFLSTVASLHPQAIRVFGGTPANFWNWRTGTYVRSPHVPSTLEALRNRVHVTLADWARLVQASGATPVFDLNLLTSDLHSQLAMLHAARRLGMPINEVELGNELYLPPYAYRFHDGAQYGRVATRWIAAIRREFPGVLVAADAYAGRDTNSSTVNERERGWNAEMLSTLRGESALSLHAYFASGLGPGASLASPVAAEQMLRSPARRWARLARLIARLPRLEVWVTEWNLFDTVARVHGTWAQGLAVASFGLDLMSAPRVVQADYETLVDSAPFGAIFGTTAGLQLASGGGGGGGQITFRAVSAHAPPTPLFGLATGGVAMQALDRALAGASALRTMSFGPLAVRGVILASRSGFGAVIVNLSRRPVAITVPRALRGLPYGERYGRPITLVAGAATLHDVTGTTGGAVELEPFSLTTIGS
ncbi:MAG TPA: hypothetical protein VG295_10255 [Solirubrobacteraceae bacterium]|nr:hypothetical protein [Solirubrobacteraceae bacterium]